MKSLSHLAKKAYEIYNRVFSGERWEKLAAKGAKPQRLLWASTSSKNPAFKDTKYVEALIGRILWIPFLWKLSKRSEIMVLLLIL